MAGLCKNRRSFLWHTSCITSFVAKKFHTQNFVKGTAEIAVANVRMPVYPTGNTAVPPRAKKIHVPRRRLEIVSFPEAVHSVKIIHTSQNLDTSKRGMQPAQSQCV
jgi:hypothetical protein